MTLWINPKNLGIVLLAASLLALGGLPALAEEGAVLVPASGIDRLMKEKHPVFLDVRSAQEIQQSGTLAGAINIPLDELAERWRELPRDRPILVACQGGYRSEKAARLLLQNGLKVLGYCGLAEYKGQRSFPK